MNITNSLLEDLEFVHRQLKTMGKGFDRKEALEYMGRSIEFVKGVLWERQRAQQELIERHYEKEKLK